jgi:KDO2-lipid IV(A) lauroyltransferase
MQFLAYILIYPFFWFLSILPFRILYGVSDVIYLLLYYIIGYRKKTVRYNLKLALPHLSDSERLVIEKKSYRHLCDMFLEMIKTISITQKEIEERFQFPNMEVYNAMEQKGKSIALMCAHYASYEWVVSMHKRVNYTGYAIYKRINNKYFDQLVRKIRMRFEAVLVPSKETISLIEHNAKEGIKGVYGFASDQSPKPRSHIFWDTFLGVEVPVHTGAEFLAKKYDMNMIYLKVEKVKRGYYQATFEVLSEDVQNVPDYQITQQFLRHVEKQIYAAPEFYLWTHKRFKHQGKKPVTN